MNESLITVRYAKAFYELASEKNILQNVRRDMEFILSLAAEVEDFRFLLSSPLIKGTEKNKIFSVLFNGQVDSITMSLLALLIENKREAYLEGICRYFLRHYKKEQGIMEAAITTAFPLSKDITKKINDFVARHFSARIELSEQVNPSIIGGFVLRVEDQQINASISSQLNRIKRELINS